MAPKPDPSGAKGPEKTESPRLAGFSPLSLAEESAAGPLGLLQDRRSLLPQAGKQRARAGRSRSSGRRTFLPSRERRALKQGKRRERPSRRRRRCSRPPRQPGRGAGEEQVRRARETHTDAAKTAPSPAGRQAGARVSVCVCARARLPFQSGGWGVTMASPPWC